LFSKALHDRASNHGNIQISRSRKKVGPLRSEAMDLLAESNEESKEQKNLQLGYP
jgi:hypothetical protein